VTKWINTISKCPHNELIVISKTPPMFFGISLIGIVGFVAAAVMGIWLLVAIIKKGKL